MRTWSAPWTKSSRPPRRILFPVKIYTRRGDEGQTDLLGGLRVAKDDARVAAYGEVDELNAVLGAALAASPHEDVRALGRRVQSELFDLGAYLATPDAEQRRRSRVPALEQAQVDSLEEQLDLFDAELEPLKSFVLPGGTPAAAAFHVARTVCRRVERQAVRLDRDQGLDPVPLRYLNRLSDLLFTLARLENRRAGVEDVAWQGRRR